METLLDAFNWVAKIQPLASQAGYSVGLTGSVLFVGASDKDIDIIIYPYKTGQENRTSLDKALNKLGLSKVRICDHSHPQYQDNKHVEEWTTGGPFSTRIDFMFLQ